MVGFAYNPAHNNLCPSVCKRPLLLVAKKKKQKKKCRLRQLGAWLTGDRAGTPTFPKKLRFRSGKKITAVLALVVFTIRKIHKWLFPSNTPAARLVGLGLGPTLACSQAPERGDQTGLRDGLLFLPVSAGVLRPQRRSPLNGFFSPDRWDRSGHQRSEWKKQFGMQAPPMAPNPVSSGHANLNGRFLSTTFLVGVWGK